ncbi:MAG: MFS transporter [Clostridia bacterium BRH_c25]|nr:MAG: MFS transporter [Clostridia bacterium BRH_c25]
MKNRDLVLFMLASAFIGISQSIDASVFNNFLNDTFHLTVSQRTILEFPRELPGFLVVFVSGALLFLGDVRIASLANMLAAFGLLGLGHLSSDYYTMMMWMTVYSMGQHLFMPMSNSIGMNLAEEGNLGKVLGRINGLNTAAYLATSLTTAFIFRYVKVNYKVAFTAGALALICACLLILFMTPHKPKVKAKRLFLKKEYKLFYWLNVLYGARKQIFITFGPWVLIKVFNQGVSTFAVLGFFIAGFGIVFKPLLGIMIDKRGERFVLASEAIALIVICAGYAFAEDVSGLFGISGAALIIICSCFVIDQMLNATTIARATYLKKIALCPEDVSPTLSMGLSIDHAVSMVVPWLGSLLWTAFGYKYVFVMGAFIAVGNLLLTRYIKTGEVA